MSHRPDWSEWILQKNSEVRQEELKKSDSVQFKKDEQDWRNLPAYIESKEKEQENAETPKLIEQDPSLRVRTPTQPSFDTPDERRGDAADKWLIENDLRDPRYLLRANASQRQKTMLQRLNTQHDKEDVSHDVHSFLESAFPHPTLPNHSVVTNFNGEYYRHIHPREGKIVATSGGGHKPHEGHFANLGLDPQQQALLIHHGDD